LGGGSVASTERPYQGFKGLKQRLQEFRSEYEKEKLKVSCDVITKAKNLKWLRKV
jgi:hypothetical protein